MEARLGSRNSGPTLLEILWRWRGLILFSGAVGLSVGVAHSLLRQTEFSSEAQLGLPPSSVGLGSAQRLASLVGATGLSLSQTSFTPDLLAAVLVSPEVLDATLQDSLSPEVTSEYGGKAYGSLLASSAETTSEMLETGRRKLTNRLSVNISAAAQTLNLAAEERSPELARWLCSRLVWHLDKALRRARITDAKGRFEYLASQVSHYETDLHGAEEALMQFTLRNRSVDASPALQLERLRLQRSVDIAQASYLTMLTQRDLAAAETSESAPQLVVYSQPTLPYRPSQIGWPFLTIAWGIVMAGGAWALAVLLTAYDQRLGGLYRLAAAVNQRLAPTKQSAFPTEPPQYRHASSG